MAAANAAVGSSACMVAYAPITRRSAPDASVTASVVSVATSPLPANTVGRYWPTLTAKATAHATSSGRTSNGIFTANNDARRSDAPRLAAERA